jgi:membrane dipeptidase
MALDYRKIHQSSTVIDTHADTFSRVLDESLDFFNRKSGLSVSLPQMISGGLDVQVFALYIAPGMPPGCTIRRAMAMAGTLFDAVRKSKGRLVLVQTGKQLEAAVRRPHHRGRFEHPAIAASHGRHQHDAYPRQEQ